MGSDDLFKKRKAKSVKDTKRKSARREAYDRVLIVCEGTKTEPYYFEGLKAEYNLHSANIRITGNCDSAPISIVEQAKKLFDISVKEQNPFDRVYCVFDKDMHTTYNDAKNKISNFNPKQGIPRFYSIESVPCFEYWLLLHFVYTDSPFSSTPTKSIGVHVESELLKFFPDYQKGNKNIFYDLKDRMNFAITNAKKANLAAQAVGSDNPTTKVLELVDYLISLKQ